MSQFDKDNKWQLMMRDRFLAGWYGENSTAGRFVFLDKGRCASLFQKRMAVDTVVQSENGGAVCVEEKIVRYPEKKNRPHTCFFLETNSCTVPGYESDGWMRYGQADYLLYCFQTKDDEYLDCWLIDFPQLQEWFWGVWEDYRAYRMPNTGNHTEGRLVPIADVKRHINTWRFSLTEPSAP
jgi:hypothetical protein